MKLIAIFSAAMLSLPILAQESTNATPAKQDAPAAEPAENTMFYRAYYLERGERRSEEAIALYRKFLEAAPKNRYAGKAATNTLALLNRAGKVEDAEAFKTKYAEILKNADVAGPADTTPANPEAGPGRGRGGEGRGAGAGGRMNVDELKKQLEKAKADGKTDEAKRLEEQIKRIEEMRAGGARGQGGQGGAAGGRRGMGAFNKPITEMNDEELGQMEQGLERMSGMMQRLRDNGMGEQADKAEAAMKKLKDSLVAGKKEDAEAARQELMKLMPGRRGGGGGL